MKLARAAHLVLGRRGEEAAVRLLLAKGYTILARNSYAHLFRGN